MNATIESVPPISRYANFTREEWKSLRANTPLLLTEQDLTYLRGINEQVSLREVEDIFVPLSRLLNLHVAAIQHLYQARRSFLGSSTPQKVTYVIGLAGSVAVGKSTFSRVLRASLARWPDHAKVDLVTTDGFLHPNRILEDRGLMQRKGFPESYDQRRLLRFLADVKAGAAGGLRTGLLASALRHCPGSYAEDRTARHPDFRRIERAAIA